ncbi:hypothetical protein RND71_024644 [Anisodus tanguticus]|uniref:Beta-glucosidase n=1 Tax=Anisodus tanguticus TaxID=243964 RepID=A0AAE1V465_9SOLA|nr:hypothetical protein RND71_024644 [Anisodus tanguticus]
MEPPETLHVIRTINTRFIKPLIFGDYPQTMRKNVGSRLPTFTKRESELIKGSLDFIGLNHYTQIYIRDNPRSLEKDLRDFNIDMGVEQTRRNATLNDTERVEYLHAYIGGVLDALR